MDTYWNSNYDKCVQCGICVKTCREEGYNILYGGRNQRPDTDCDVLPCHHCGKCEEKCPYGAVEITRW